jgi:hypothetical protein
LYPILIKFGGEGFGGVSKRFSKVVYNNFVVCGVFCQTFFAVQVILLHSKISLIFLVIVLVKSGKIYALFITFILRSCAALL